MSRKKCSAILHYLLIALGILSIPLYVFERWAYERERDRFSMALEAADAGRWFWDLHDGRIFWDDVTFSLFGLSKGPTLSYEEFLAIIHPEDRLRARGLIDKAIFERGGYQDIFRIITPEGEVREIRASGMVDPTGRFMTGINLPALHRQGNFLRRDSSDRWPVPGDPSFSAEG